jgi:hypothetical protein
MRRAGGCRYEVLPRDELWVWGDPGEGGRGSSSPLDTLDLLYDTS